MRNLRLDGPARSLLIGWALSLLLAAAVLWPDVTLALLSGPVPTTPVWSADLTLPERGDR